MKVLTNSHNHGIIIIERNKTNRIKKRKRYKTMMKELKKWFNKAKQENDNKKYEKYETKFYEVAEKYGYSLKETVAIWEDFLFE